MSSTTRLQKLQKYCVVHGSTLLLPFVGLSALSLMLLQAECKSPVHDEVGQLYSCIATVRFGDPAYYRVNPPLHRWVSGLVVDAFCEVPIPRPYAASATPSGDRPEYAMGTTAIAASPNLYGWHYFVGRVPRILILVAFAWALQSWFPMLPHRARTMAAIFYLTSPLTLGHGWTTMPDGLSGAAVTLLMASTLRWLNCRTWSNSLLVGLSWGVCLNTKFTFCPMYLLWAVPLVFHELIAKRLSWSNVLRMALAHTLHGFIALFFTMIMYEGRDIGVPMEDHSFASSSMKSLGSALGKIPSPFPEQYLIGIDEQNLFLERGVPTYFAGKVYPEGMWWYYLVGVFAKEQVVFLVATLASLAWFIWSRINRLTEPKRRKETPRYELDDEDISVRESRAAAWFLVGVVVMVFGILSYQTQMALNVRYLFPAMPACYLLLGLGVDSLLQSVPNYSRHILTCGLIVIATELFYSTPHQFAYINPCFGGSYHVPAALHDSNFGGGQDVWELEKWHREHPVPEGTERYYAFYTDVARSVIKLPDAVPPEIILSALVNAKTSSENVVPNVAPGKTGKLVNAEVVISRDLQVPAPWHRLWGQTERFHDLIHRTSTIYPDEFITPTMLVYRFQYSQQKDADQSLPSDNPDTDGSRGDEVRAEQEPQAIRRTE